MTTSFYIQGIFHPLFCNHPYMVHKYPSPFRILAHCSLHLRAALCGTLAAGLKDSWGLWSQQVMYLAAVAPVKVFQEVICLLLFVFPVFFSSDCFLTWQVYAECVLLGSAPRRSSPCPVLLRILQPDLHIPDLWFLISASVTPWAGFCHPPPRVLEAQGTPCGRLVLGDVSLYCSPTAAQQLLEMSQFLEFCSHWGSQLCLQ